MKIQKSNVGPEASPWAESLLPIIQHLGWTEMELLKSEAFIRIYAKDFSGRRVFLHADKSRCSVTTEQQEVSPNGSISISLLNRVRFPNTEEGLHFFIHYILNNTCTEKLAARNSKYLDDPRERVSLFNLLTDNITKGLL
jgi:hypothetical protein